MSPDCWCRPRVQRVCLECLEMDPACWLCQGEGWIDVAPEDIDSTDEQMVIIHETGHQLLTHWYHARTIH